MVVDSKDNFVSRVIKTQGFWEPHIANLIKHLVKEGDIAVNLGSQTGMEALIIAREIGPKGHIYVFEPYSYSYQIMRKNFMLNGFQDRVTTYNMGVSNKFQMGT